jgi:hypothetical protein
MTINYTIKTEREEFARVQALALHAIGLTPDDL